MTTPFNTYIQHPEMEQWRRLCLKEGTLMRYETGEEFASRGQTARYVGFIVAGTLKYIACDELGSEHVVGFEFAGEFVADFPFSLRGEVSRTSIVADSPCRIYCIPVCNIAERMKTDTTLALLVARSTELLFSQTYDRYLTLYCQSAEQRYLTLIKKYPDIFNLFSLKDIASYLNITPTHLSRIKKTLKAETDPHRNYNKN